MQELLAELDDWLQHYLPAYYVQLLPGLTSDELADFEIQIGHPLTEELRTLYKWKNGQPYNCVTGIFDSYSFMSATEIVAAKRDLDKLAEFEYSDGWWSPSWMPFLSDNSGGYYCVDLIGCFGLKGQVILFTHDNNCHYIYFPSLTKWLETLVKGLQQGIAMSDNFEGYCTLENLTKVQAFIRAENPGYPIEIPHFEVK